MSDTITVTSLFRYPVKGMTPEKLDRVALLAGGTMPADRQYAIENGPGRFDPAAPRHLPKITFLMLMRDERLASLQSHFDDATGTLTILRDGKPVAKGQLNTTVGRALIEQFIAAYMQRELRGAPKIVAADGHSFSDVPVKCLHLINLATVRDLERITGRAIDPLRFRANVHIDGCAPWSELAWLDKTLTTGGVRLSVYARTQRCDATNVDPVTAKRDMALPEALQRSQGHSDFGIYAKVAADGTLAIGDVISVA